MIRVVSSSDEVTAEWVLSVLRKTEDLPDGAIASVHVDKSWNTISSRIEIVRIEYDRARPSLPRTLFLKFTLPEVGGTLRGLIGRKEVDFYDRLSSLPHDDDFLRCYHADFDPGTLVFNLVFEDLNPTHGSSDWPLSPTLPHCRQVVGCLAKVHARWWDHSGLDAIRGRPLLKSDRLREFDEFCDRTLEPFARFMGDRMPPGYADAIESFRRNFERLSERILSRKRLTLVHGDSHFWNFLFPKEPAGKVKIVDWQSYSVGVGASDLAYTIAMHWYPSRRKEHELPLLEHYHGQLLANGVRDYSFEDLLLDYRWAVVDRLTVPIWQWDAKVPASVWVGHLERIQRAFEDLNCGELLEC